MASRFLGFFLFVFAVAISPVTCTIEADALSALKKALVDPNGILESWDERFTDPCTWFHVVCSRDNKVIKLDLGDYGLGGSLVPELGLLGDLESLEMFQNNITGPIPIELGNLSKLISLELYENKLNGTIPDSFGKLKALRFMRLNNNQLTGKVPESVKALEKGNLMILDVTNNPLSD
ncbi:leucine-rich repeat protein 1-like [Mangifera indica]|uniref:leucine-rich repeat protein 1-like n=1 Tax=Mangifera indica TaxID=29780 RepID=UPI001CF95FF7|nr:leucine-rich repeat protein 1-like [Mangifera indica]